MNPSTESPAAPVHMQSILSHTIRELESQVEILKSEIRLFLNSVSVIGEHSNFKQELLERAEKISNLEDQANILKKFLR